MESESSTHTASKFSPYFEVNQPFKRMLGQWRYKIFHMFNALEIRELH
jgi:hypothetical protein